jgi:hypothetical protein
LNPVTNMAHEIGHVIGLMHEHQRAIAWKSVSISFGTDETGSGHGHDPAAAQTPAHASGSTAAPAPAKGYENGAAHEGSELIHFQCENLADYEKHKAAIKEKPKLCTSYGEAKAAGFTAADILPMPSQFGNQDENFDWESIMLYPSKAGGKIAEKAKAPTPKDDTRQVVMKKPEGDTWGPNHRPSKHDIAAVKKL